MPAVFDINLSKFHDFISVWYGSAPQLHSPRESSYEILYPRDYLPTSNAAQSALIDKFVEGLERALHVKREEICRAELWKQDCPDGLDSSNIIEYLKFAGCYPFFHDEYRAPEDFRNDHERKHGKPPFVHRYLNWQWELARTISKEERDMGWNRLEIYRYWLLDKIFKADSEDHLTIMVVPIEEGKPNYRDSEIPPCGVLNGFSALNISPIMRAPEVTTMIGENTYQSIVTKRAEPLPIGASVISAPGTDLILADVVETGMKAGGFPTKLKTGRFIH